MGIDDGRYQGRTETLFIDLRVDAEGSGAVSADVFRIRAEGQEYGASVRTQENVKEAPGNWLALWQLNPAHKVTGTISLDPAGDRQDAVLVTLRLDEPLNRLPAKTDLVIEATRTSAALRSIGIEIDVEEGVALPAPVTFGGVARNLEECLGRAGFAVKHIGEPTPIQRGEAARWSDSAIYTALHAIMLNSAKVPETRAWELRLLMLGESQLPSLRGVMFDFQDTLPRQGAAVFASTFAEENRDRNLLRTMIHELGHALNLAHRFEREVGRRDSASFMNYPHRYRGVDPTRGYFDAFSFAFDADELSFLRHGPRGAVIPGGEPFHSVRYWADGGHPGGNPEVEFLPFARMTLSPPATGPAFVFGQPVFLTVALHNTGEEDIQLNSAYLDPKVYLEFTIERQGVQVPFVPSVQRCVDQFEPSSDVVIPSGQKLENNVQLTFGSGGFTFAEPGVYDITPHVVITRRNQQLNLVDFVVRGETLRITVLPPVDDREAETLMRSDVGALFTLGGADALQGAADALAEIADRRGPQDPVAAAILRAAGLNAGRESVRMAGDRLVTREADPALAAELLTGLNLDAFDPLTARETRRLAATFTRDANG